MENPVSAKYGVLHRLCIVLLCLGTFVRCSCEEDTFTAAANYDPEAVLDFGEVSVSSQKTLTVEVLSAGGAALKLVPALDTADPDPTWTVVLDPELMEGLTPARTASITVTYRPCPDAWDGDTLKEGFDYGTCPSNLHSADLNLAESDLVGNPTTAGSHRIVLSGSPVQPANARINCPRDDQCGVDPAMLPECVSLTFGAVNAGETPCDLTVELENSWRPDTVCRDENCGGNPCPDMCPDLPVGELVIDRVEVKVRDLNGDRVTVDGDEVGFSILDAEGSPLTIDSANPFVVPIDSGDTGSRRLKVRFDGSRTGFWRGQASDETGVRFYTNDADRPIITVSVTAFGSAPEIEVNPPFFGFGAVEQGTTASTAITVSNAGDADLLITDISTQMGNAEFQVTTSVGRNTDIKVCPVLEDCPDGVSKEFEVYVSYTPQDAGNDDERVLITSNDLLTPVAEIELTGGAVPRISVQPPDTLVFPLGNPPPRRECLTISNVGAGDLEIQRLELTGPGGDPAHPSVDDFSFDDSLCPMTGSTCTPAPPLVLCPPTNPACTVSSHELCLRYDNNDISSTDDVELRISSNDRSNQEYVVVLRAADEPCFFPTPIFDYQPASPCPGEPVFLNAAASTPGGTGSGTTIDVYDWTFFFTEYSPSPMITPDSLDPARASFIPEQGGIHILGFVLGE